MMKIFSSLPPLLLSLFMFACAGPEDTVPTTPVFDNTDDLSTAMLISQGALSGANGYTSIGDVQLVRSADGQTYSLVFENFSSSNGPDLKVYLSTNSSASNFINLGNLKSVSGTLRYDFPASQFNPQFDTALIWCQQFGVLFGVAALTSL